MTDTASNAITANIHPTIIRALNFLNMIRI